MEDPTSATGVAIEISLEAAQTLFDSCKEAVVVKLIEKFKAKDAEILFRVLWHLSEEEKQFKENIEKSCADSSDSEAPVQSHPSIPSGLKALNATIDLDDLFILYAKLLADDTKEPHRNPAFLKDMKYVLQKLDEEYPEDELVGVDDIDSEVGKNAADANKFVLVYVPQNQEEKFRDPTSENGKGHSSGGGIISNTFWYMIETATKHAVIRAIPPIFVNRQLYFALDELIGIIDRTGPGVVMIGLAAIFLSCDAIKNLYQWWAGEISGKRCAKNFVDATFLVGGGVLGGMGGAAMGCAMGGPFGTVAGGIIGGIVSSTVLHALCDKLTQSLFGLPHDAALENALNFLGVPMTASNEEINTAFRKLCLKYHPDKGGASEDFILLQANMAVIKLARKELL